MSGAVRINNYQRPVELLEISKRGEPKKQEAAPAAESFATHFTRELGSERPVQFSKHAAQRLHSRGIELSDEQMRKIAQGIDTAEQKGSRETLILSDEAAFVVSVKNRTVITAFDKGNLRDGIVTAIDSAIIL